jgi:hypothetical protein
VDLRGVPAAQHLSAPGVAFRFHYIASIVSSRLQSAGMQTVHPLDSARWHRHSVAARTRGNRPGRRVQGSDSRSWCARIHAGTPCGDQHRHPGAKNSEPSASQQGWRSGGSLCCAPVRGVLVLLAVTAVAALWIAGEQHRQNCISQGRVSCSVLPWDAGENRPPPQQRPRK